MDEETAYELLEQTAASWGLALSVRQIEQLRTYAALLLRWNERLNLTRITTPDGIVVRHFLDSLTCALYWGAPASLIDVGAGGGFPGIPLAIARPGLQLTLVESVAKKADFLHHAASELALPTVTVLSARAEAVGRDGAHREQYDVAVARAVAELRVLAEYCLPLVRVGGRFLAPKGGQSEQEIAAAVGAIERLGGQLQVVAPVLLPGREPQALVVVEKITPTPALYPRAVGIPAKRPLGS